MKKKKVILVIIVAIIVFSIIYNLFLKNEEADFTLVDVVRGDVVQEVSETGQVQMGKDVNLSFKNTGTLQRVFVKVGDNVWPGSYLAQLTVTQLIIERNESQASLDIAQAKLDQLLEGATPEETQAAQTDVDNAQVDLNNTKQEYEEDLSQAYEDALNTMDNAYLKGSGALTTVTSIKESYFDGSDQGAITVKEKKDNISILVSAIKTNIDQAQELSTNENIDTALSVIKNSLNDIYDDLNSIQGITESSDYINTVSSADKTLLNTERLNINTVLTNIINSQQTITLAKIDGEANVNTAEGNLQEAKDDLALITAEPSQADINLYEAQVKQAKASVDLLVNKISESTLKSPIQGKVVQINKEVGEIVQPSLSESVIVLLPATPYEIEVDIYEEDIVKMKVGNQVEISLIAFPDEIFWGKVISINPAEELIEGVVYYTITIGFEETPEGIRPGMTADLLIKTDSREDVLIIPEDAIQEQDGKDIVKVFTGEETKDREVEIGLIGSDYMVEILSGLEEGEKVVVE